MIYLKKFDAFLISEQGAVISKISKAIQPAIDDVVKPVIDDAVKATRSFVDDAVKSGKSLLSSIIKIKSNKDFIKWANSKTTPDGTRVVEIISDNGKLVARIGNTKNMANSIKEEIEVSNPTSLLDYIENYNKAFKEGSQILFIEKIPNLNIVHNARASRINEGELSKITSTDGGVMYLYKQVSNGKVFYYFQRGVWKDKFLAGKATNILLNKIPKGGLVAEPRALSLDSFYFYLRRVKDKRFSPQVDGYIELNAQSVYKSKLPQFKQIFGKADKNRMSWYQELSFKTEKTATKLKNLIDAEISKVGLGEEFFSKIKRNDKNDWTLELPRIVLKKL